jgi:hypothetical protein
MNFTVKDNKLNFLDITINKGPDDLRCEMSGNPQPQTQ